MIEITLNHRKPRDENRQIAYISVSGLNDYLFRFQVGDIPASLTTDQEVQDHLDSRKDELHLFCLRKTYSGADPWDFKDPDKSELENFLDWIDAGHKNKILVGHDPEKDEPIYEYEEIRNHTFAGTHPLRYPPSQADLQEAMAILAPFSDQTFQELEDRVEQDEEFLKEISLVILALIRYIDHKSS
ncbi:MAG: hypothetical protein KAU46_10380 [Candidatus Aminicenantes bacterium]|nr:hypothetical protein [Candidatus Aminicenantes bacterium]